MKILLCLLLPQIMSYQATANIINHLIEQTPLVSFDNSSQQTSTKTKPLTGKPTRPQLQHGVNYSAVEDITNYLVSEKLDGVRGYWDGSQLFSRQGKPITSPTWFTRHWPSQAMDGELWMARGQFQPLLSCVTKHKPDEIKRSSCWRHVSFKVFDLTNRNGTFAQRFTRIKQLVTTNQSPYLSFIKQHKVTTLIALDNILSEVIKNGGEGLMLHHVNAQYTIGRNSDLMKLKKHQDAEATIIGFSKGKGKYQGKIGAFVVETLSGVKFKIGSGLTDSVRDNPPPIGTLITFKYNGLTQAGIPRFARFWRIKKLDKAQGL
jgi:DNA ligase-1